MRWCAHGVAHGRAAIGAAHHTVRPEGVAAPLAIARVSVSAHPVVLAAFIVPQRVHGAMDFGSADGGGQDPPVYIL